MKKRNEKRAITDKIYSILTTVDYVIIAFSVSFICFYLGIIILIVLAKRFTFLNQNFVAWTFIAIVGFLSLIVGYFMWIKIDRGTKWATAKLNLLVYHLNEAGQTVVFCFIWILGVSFCVNAISSDSSVFTSFISSDLFKSLNAILTLVLGILSVFNFGKIPIYKLRINWKITFQKNDRKLNIWATNIGSGCAAYRFLGIYKKSDIDRVSKEKENRVLSKDLKNLNPLYLEKENINFQNLNTGNATKIRQIFLYDIKGIDKIKSACIIYESSLGKVEFESIDLTSI